MVSQAIRTATPTLSQLARWCELSYHAAQSYRLGRRSAPSTVLRRLARVLRQQAARLGALADRLDAEAERNP